MMSSKLSKKNIFNFLKEKNIVEELTGKEYIEIIENKNIGTTSLSKVKFIALNDKSKYWTLDTESESFQIVGKKVEKIILEETREGVLNIIMIEMKSTSIKRKVEEDIYEKFEKSFEFVYILLQLLSNKDGQKFNLFGILIAQKEMKWNSIENLDILSSTSIRYTKRSFFTKNSEIEIKFQELIKEIKR